MIERFNFFDVYAYLLPGGLLITLLWLPFGLILGKWPSGDLASAAMVLGIAYITGHLVRIFSDVVFLSKFRSGDTWLYPSYLLLDNKKHDALSIDLGALRGTLQKQIHTRFNIDIAIDSEWSKQLERERANGFLACRSFLVQNKAAAYAEQQQGMYELLRGVATAFVLSSIFYFGLSLCAWLPSGFRPIAICGVFVVLICALFSAWSIRYAAGKRADGLRVRLFWLLAGTLFLVSVALAAPSKPGSLQKITLVVDTGWAMILIAQGLLVLTLGILCVYAFRNFAVNFAATIYRDCNAFWAQPAQQPVPDDERV